MKPKNFKEANVTFAKDQPEYQPLPAFRADSQDGEVITCCKDKGDEGDNKSE